MYCQWFHDDDDYVLSSISEFSATHELQATRLDMDEFTPMHNWTANCVL